MLKMIWKKLLLLTFFIFVILCKDCKGTKQSDGRLSMEDIDTIPSKNIQSPLSSIPSLQTPGRYQSKFFQRMSNSINDSSQPSLNIFPNVAGRAFTSNKKRQSKEPLSTWQKPPNSQSKNSSIDLENQLQQKKLTSEQPKIIHNQMQQKDQFQLSKHNRISRDINASFGNQILTTKTNIPDGIKAKSSEVEPGSYRPSSVLPRTNRVPHFEVPHNVSQSRTYSFKRASRGIGLSQYPPSDSSPQFRYKPIEQTVSPGSPVSLKCSADGSPSPVITWTRDNQPLISSHRVRLGSFLSGLGGVVSHINLTDVTVTDGGLYKCTAHNEIGSVSYSARINVYGAPFVRSMPNITAVAGDNVHLYCPAGGFPLPSITWRKEGQVLSNSLRYRMLHNGSLVVKRANHKDIGQYSCVVSNRQGQTAASHLFLQIIKPPAIDPFSFVTKLEEGLRTSVTCTVNSGDLPMTMNWLKEGRHLQHDPDIEKKRLNEFSIILFFKNLQEHHSGSYTCEAANAAATVNHTAILLIEFSPRWITEPTSSTALVGSTSILECNARGYPKPVITWKKATNQFAQDFQPIIMDGIRSSQVPNGSLVLTEISKKDSGWYLCHVDNSIGKGISKSLQLTIQAPARVITEGGTVMGHSGQSVTLTCEAKGDSPLTLSWQRNQTPLTTNHRLSIRESNGGGRVKTVLEIRSLIPNDAGSYICRADNSYGDDVQAFNIVIIEPPEAPSDVAVSEISSRSVSISWTLTQTAAVTIQYKAVKEESWAIHGRNVSVGEWASSHVLSGLIPHQFYAIRLFSRNDLGVSLPSPVLIFTTLPEAPSGTPNDVQVTAKGARSLLVSWRAPDQFSTNGPLRGYTLTLRQQNLQGHITHITRPATLSLGTSGDESYEVTDLNPSSLYEVAVRAFNRAGPGPLSSPRIVQATGHDAPMCPSGGISCRSSGKGSIRVWWAPPSMSCVNAPVSGYKIIATPTTHTYGPQSFNNNWEVKTTNLEKSLDNLPPATNISIIVKAFNDIGSSPPSNPVFCVTEDDVPGPPLRVRVIVTGSSSILVTWSPPHPTTGAILHYTLYSERENQVAVRDVVGASGSEATWREISNLKQGARVQIWVTATTVAGEGSPSLRFSAVPKTTEAYPPISVGGTQLFHVSIGARVTLGCRGIGTPPPMISWIKDHGYPIGNSQFTQLLPGGDLHLSGVRESSNYTCWVKNSKGTDSLTHQVIVATPPVPPMLNLATATHNSLNLTITKKGDGGAPLLGYTLHYREQAGDWTQINVEPSTLNVMLYSLSCGASYHLYITAWNSQGTSTPSQVLIAKTQGKEPGRPDPGDLVEVNTTCTILRLYAWPEMGCAITHWKVDKRSETDSALWQPVYSHVSRDEMDLSICEFSSSLPHLLRLTAVSSAGETSVTYRIATHDHKGGSITAESIQEVVIEEDGLVGWLDAHVVAGIASAFLLAIALVICACVVFRRHTFEQYRKGESMDNKGVSEEDNVRNCEIAQNHLYSPTPTKKSRGSLASLKTLGDQSDPYELYPYATFSVDNSEATLEYGLSLQCRNPGDGADYPIYSDRQSLKPPAYGHASRRNSQSQYKDTEVAYISNTRRKQGDYGNRTKSISGTNPTPASTPTLILMPETDETKRLSEEEAKDITNCPIYQQKENTGAFSNPKSNDAISPIPREQHYHHPKVAIPHAQYPQEQISQQHSRVHQQCRNVAVPMVVGRGQPHPLPPVRLARNPSKDSSSNDSSPLTPPVPLHPPSAFSDSRELSETECDRDIHSGHNRRSLSSLIKDGASFTNDEAGANGEDDDIKAELTLLLQQYQDQRQNLKYNPKKNPYLINV